MCHEIIKHTYGYYNTNLFYIKRRPKVYNGNDQYMNERTASTPYLYGQYEVTVYITHNIKTLNEPNNTFLVKLIM